MRWWGWGNDLTKRVIICIPKCIFYGTHLNGLGDSSVGRPQDVICFTDGLCSMS